MLLYKKLLLMTFGTTLVSLETEGKFKYLTIRLRNENYEMKLPRQCPFRDVMQCHLVTIQPYFEETKCLKVQKISYPEDGKKNSSKTQINYYQTTRYYN